MTPQFFDLHGVFPTLLRFLLGRQGAVWYSKKESFVWRSSKLGRPLMLLKALTTEGGGLLGAKKVLAMPLSGTSSGCKKRPSECGSLIGQPKALQGTSLRSSNTAACKSMEIPLVDGEVDRARGMLARRSPFFISSSLSSSILIDTLGLPDFLRCLSNCHGARYVVGSRRRRLCPVLTSSA